MKNIIRIPGFLAFIIIIILLVGGVYLFAEPLLKTGIEKMGTAMVGARVDVGEVKLRLNPASISLIKMTVTDVDQPMQNLFEFDKAVASIELLKLMMGQTIINDLAVDGLRFETPRKTSGAIPKKIKSKKQKEEEKLAFKQKVESITAVFPDADDVLASEPLLIDQRKQEWDAIYKEKKQAWEDIKKQLPTEEKLHSYEVKLKAITNDKIKSLDDFNERKDQLKALKKEIKSDKEILLQAQIEIKNSKTILQEHLINLKNAPKEDWDRLRDKYSLDGGGLANLSGLLFGNQINTYTNTGLYWYKKVKPYIESNTNASATEEIKKERLAGRFVRFPESNPMPDILIKKMALSATIARGDLAIKVYNLTHQQNIINKPTTARITSTALNNIKNLELDATFDYRTTKGKSHIQFSLEDVTVDEIKISGGSDFPLALASSLVNIKGEVKITDNQLSGLIHSDFTDAIFLGEAHSSFTKELLIAIQSINAFDLDTQFSGNLKDIDFSLDSNLDKRLKAAFSDRIDIKKQEFEAKINQQLQAKLTRYLGDGNQLDIFGDSKAYDQQINNLEKLLEEKLDDYKDEQKKELKNKAKNKLKSLL